MTFNFAMISWYNFKSTGNKNKQVEFHQKYKLLCMEGHKSEQASHRMGENICKAYVFLFFNPH